MSAITLGKEEEAVFDCLKLIIKSQALQHLNLSDTGLTENMLLLLSKTIKVSHCLLSVHLSGNPGVKDHIMQRFEGKLKATYETPLQKQTFKSLLKLYDNKYGLADANKGKNMRDSYLDHMEERDSLSSGSLNFHSEKHKIDPKKLKEQIMFKNNLIEKEASIPMDDAKVDRDHKRHFMVTRVLGHDLDMPGASDWQVSNESA